MCTAIDILQQEVSAKVLSRITGNCILGEVVAVMLLSGSRYTGVLVGCVSTVDAWKSNSRTEKCWKLVGLSTQSEMMEETKTWRLPVCTGLLRCCRWNWLCLVRSVARPK